MLVSFPTRLMLEAQVAEPRPSKTVYVSKTLKAPLLSEHGGGASLRARPSVAKPAELPAPPVPTGGNGDQSASIGWTRGNSKTTNRSVSRLGALVWLRIAAEWSPSLGPADFRKCPRTNKKTRAAKNGPSPWDVGGGSLNAETAAARNTLFFMNCNPQHAPIPMRHTSCVWHPRHSIHLPSPVLPYRVLVRAPSNL